MAAVVLLAGCGEYDTSAVELPTTEATVAPSARDVPALVPTTAPALTHFIAQPDGSLRASLSDLSFDEGVLFEYASAQLTPAALDLLEELLPEIEAHHGPVAVEGFTDGVGPADWNQRLSERRAEAVATWLMEAGILNEIAVIGHGEEGSENDLADPSRRRVDITLEVRDLEVGDAG